MPDSNTDGVLDELVVIPARFRSSRLPGKPLVDIAGKPMIVRTVERCRRVVPNDQIVVATDDQRIAKVCADEGIHVQMTGDHPTGGDRVAEVATRIAAKTYINVQGDEPVFNPSDITLAIEAARKDRDKAFIGYCRMTFDEWADSKYIKLLFGLDRQLIYIGRASVPGSHDGTFRFAYRQVCVYAYPGHILRRFAATGGRTPLESVEDNEVMRFLELGIPVTVLEMSPDSIPVDRASDIPLVERRLAEEAAGDRIR